jgi:Mce-associated membrane protein
MSTDSAEKIVDVTTPRTETPSAPPPGIGKRTISVRVSTVIMAVGLVASVIAAVVLGALLWSAKADIDSRDVAARNAAHAQQAATDYAVGASSIDFRDINAWLARLKSDTSPQLANKFDATAPKLQEILVPLQWTSTGSPIAAAIASQSGGIYSVNVFLNVTSTSAQSPDGAQTTVTYNVTVDSNSDWQITDVGGMDVALPAR